MGASGDKKIGFEFSGGSRWMVLSMASTSTNETGTSLGKAGPLETDADTRATLGRWVTLTTAVIGVKLDGAAMSTLDSAFSGISTQSGGPFPGVAPGTWWSGLSSADKTAWVDVYWTTVKHLVM